MKFLIWLLKKLLGEPEEQRTRPRYGKVWAVRPPFDEYDTVRVVKLLEPDRWFSGTTSVERAPEVGDEGVVTNISDDSPEYCVECMDGLYMVWRAYFVAEEIERVEDVRKE
jgi:hypothetical protein